MKRPLLKLSLICYLLAQFLPSGHANGGRPTPGIEMTIYSLVIPYGHLEPQWHTAREFAIYVSVLIWSCFGAVANVLYAVTLFHRGSRRATSVIAGGALLAALLAVAYVAFGWQFQLNSGNHTWLIAFALLLGDIWLRPGLKADSSDSSPRRMPNLAGGTP